MIKTDGGRRVVAFLIVALVLFGGWAIWADGNKSEPISALGMTAEERESNDASVIAEELGGNLKVEIGYSDDAIIVRTNIPSTKQYAADEAGRIEEAVEDALNSRRGDLTLEKDSYYIYVYGSDKRLLNF